MGYSRLLKRRPKIEGEIGRSGLVDWWLATFTVDERDYVENQYSPPDELGNLRHLTQGKVAGGPKRPLQLLLAIARGLTKPTDWPLLDPVLAKAGELIQTEQDVLDLHFAYRKAIASLYKTSQADPSAREALVDACEAQVGLAPKAAQAFKKRYPLRSLPPHSGFSKLAAIAERQGDYAEAVRLSTEALSQGWGSKRNWESRIARCGRKKKGVQRVKLVPNGSA